MTLTIDRARELMNQFSQCRLLVVGDLMLDRYVSGRVERISPEAPVPIVHVTSERSVPGGACNVGLNIQALGGQSELCGVVGTCSHGKELLGHLEKAGVGVGAVLQDPKMETIVKTRVVSDRHQLLRVDRESTDIQPLVDSDDFREKLHCGLQGIQGVILEDYGKGVLQQSLVRQALDYCQEHHIPSGLDPKDNHELDVRGITFATPNRKEAFTVAGLRDKTPDVDPKSDENLHAAMKVLCKLWEPENLLITLGPQGMWIHEKEGRDTHLSTRAREVFDVSGAGDTVIATAMLALSVGAKFVEAAELANVAAGIVVGKLGTATTSQEEILAEMEKSR
ncbi:PfkB family carbohydrate kinase [Kiritimatiellaeota bacterium B1221]|nr:PfkB family carbohydrate kinase [Kiritimatiellaeota bacterium B1221]